MRGAAEFTMIEGVEILAEKVVYFYEPNWLLGLIVFIVICIIGLIISICEGEEIFLIFGIIVGLVGGLLALGFSEASTEINYIEYKVTVSESVSLSEFTEKYSIISQEGKIYTIKEREDAAINNSPSS